jgi:hypothetical protein
VHLVLTSTDICTDRSPELTNRRIADAASGHRGSRRIAGLLVGAGDWLARIMPEILA